MNISVLAFDGCPNAEPAIKLAHEAVRQTGVDAEIRRVEVQDEPEAVRHGFLGSPSIQIDGVDIETSRHGDPPSFSCRVYRTPAPDNDEPSRTTGVPPLSMLTDAIARHGSE